MSLHTLDYVIDHVIGPEISYSRRTLMENLRPGRRYAGCAGKLKGQWVFTEAGIQRLLDRLYGDEPVELDEPEPPTRRLPSGMSPNSPRVRQRAG